MFLRSLCFLALCIASCSARAELVVGTFSEFDGHQPTGNLLPGKIYGQSFTAPAGAGKLTQASFWMQAFPLDTHDSGPFTVDFTAYLMAWDGQKGIQPILTESHASMTALTGDMTRVNFEFQNASLVDSGQYVVFFSPTPSTVLRFVNLGSVSGDLYSGGLFTFPYAGSLSNVSNRDWNLWPWDLAFELRFAPVPEPSSIAQSLIGGVALALLLWRRR